MSERERAKAIILQIVSESGGDFAGRTLLYKAFYGAHLVAFGEFHRVLSEWPIVKMPRGPGIDDGKRLLGELVEAGQLEETLALFPLGQSEYQYKLLCSPPDIFSPEERRAIKTATEWAKRWIATHLSDRLHETYSWIHAEMGKPQDIYLDVIPDEELSEELSRVSELSRMAKAIMDE